MLFAVYFSNLTRPQSRNCERDAITNSVSLFSSSELTNQFQFASQAQPYRYIHLIDPKYYSFTTRVLIPAIQIDWGCDRTFQSPQITAYVLMLPFANWLRLKVFVPVDKSAVVKQVNRLPSKRPKIRIPNPPVNLVIDGNSVLPGVVATLGLMRQCVVLCYFRYYGHGFRLLFSIQWTLVPKGIDISTARTCEASNKKRFT